MVKVPIRLPEGKTCMLRLDGKLKELLDGFKDAVHNHNTSAVLVIDGRSGLGKTTLSNQVGAYLDDNFSLDNIYFEPEKFLQGLANAKPGSYVCFDEAMLISNRAALSQINKAVVVAMSMIRSKRIFVTFCVNSIFDLDRNLAISRADLMLHVYGQTLIDRGNFTAFFKGLDGTDRLKQLYLWGRKNYDYGRPKSNFFGNFPKEFIVDEKEYEKRKQEGINNFLLGAKPTETKALAARNKMGQYLHNQLGYSVEKIMEISGLSVASTYRMLNKQANLPIFHLSND